MQGKRSSTNEIIVGTVSERCILFVKQRIGALSTVLLTCKNATTLLKKAQNHHRFHRTPHKVVISEKHPVSNHALRSLENRRETLYKKMKRSKTDKSIQDYKLIKKKIRAKVKSIHSAEITKMLKNRSMKCVWQGVNTICGRKTQQTELFALSDPDNGKTVTGNKECAKIFAKTFSSKVERLVKQVGNKDAMADEVTVKFLNNSDDRNPQFETTNIISAICSMKTPAVLAMTVSQ